VYSTGTYDGGTLGVRKGSLMCVGTILVCVCIIVCVPIPNVCLTFYQNGT
jgi:hypothetical protein